MDPEEEGVQPSPSWRGELLVGSGGSGVWGGEDQRNSDSSGKAMVNKRQKALNGVPSLWASLPFISSPLQYLVNDSCIHSTEVS